MTYEQAFQILILLAGVVVFWLSHRSFPPGQTRELIDQLTKASQQTQTKVDDVLVEVAKLLLEMQPSAPPSSPISEIEIDDGSPTSA